jgi:hypothetical protein
MYSSSEFATYSVSTCTIRLASYNPNERVVDLNSVVAYIVEQLCTASVEWGRDQGLFWGYILGGEEDNKKPEKTGECFGKNQKPTKSHLNTVFLVSFVDLCGHVPFHRRLAVHVTQRDLANKPKINMKSGKHDRQTGFQGKWTPATTICAGYHLCTNCYRLLVHHCDSVQLAQLWVDTYLRCM